MTKENKSSHLAVLGLLFIVGMSLYNTLTAFNSKEELLALKANAAKESAQVAANAASHIEFVASLLTSSYADSDTLETIAQKPVNKILSPNASAAREILFKAVTIYNSAVEIYVRTKGCKPSITLSPTNTLGELKSLKSKMLSDCKKHMNNPIKKDAA